MKSALISLLFLTITASARAESLKTAFDDYSGSFLSSELVFTCGAETFKLEKSILKKHTLYWKSGLDWDEIPNVIVKDTGITFGGLVLTGHLPKQILNVNADLPIYNGAKNPNRYFTLVNSDRNYPLTLTIDFYHSVMTTTNQLNAPHQLSFNREKYLKDQKTVYRPQEFMIQLDDVWKIETNLELLENEKTFYSNPLLYKDKLAKIDSKIQETKRQLTKAKHDKKTKADKKRKAEHQEDLLRLQEISTAADKYRDGFVLTIPAGGYKKTNYCSLAQ